jgi:nucleoid-associated protein YgaU
LLLWVVISGFCEDEKKGSAQAPWVQGNVMAAWSEMSASARGGVGVAVAVVVVVLGWLGFGRTPDVELPAPVQVAAEAPKTEVPAAPAATVEPAALPTPEAAPAVSPPAEVGAPKLDVLRVTPEGETTVAGQAAPGDMVSFQLDGKEILTATADASGNFVGLLTLPPSAEARMLSVVTKGADGVARVVDVAVAPVKGPVVAEVAAPAVEAVATEAPAVVTEAPAALLISPEGVKVAQSGSAEVAAPVAMQAITYAPDGAVQLAGKGVAGSGVRIYLDQALVSQAVVAADGSWGVTLGDTAPGIYTLRIDQIDAAGKVTGRFETPFKRETLEALAAASGAATAPAAPVVTAEVAAPAAEAAAPVAEAVAPVVAAETAVPTPDATVPATTAEAAPPAAPVEATTPAAAVAPAGAAEAVPAAEPVAPVVASETAPKVGETALAAGQAPASEAAPTVSGGAEPVAPAVVAALPTPAAEPVAPAKTAVSITVQPGFTLWGIAKSQMGEGVMYVQVFEANKARIKNPDLIYPGQVFTIPGSP